MGKRGLFFLAVFMFGLINLINLQAVTRETLAVLPLSGNVSSEHRTQIQGFMTTELFSTNRFRIVERARIQEVMREQQLHSLSLGFAEMQRLGRALGVSKIIAGEITSFWGTVQTLSPGTNIQGMIYTANVRMIDVQTGFIYIAVTSHITTGRANLARDIVRQIMEIY